MNWTEIIIAFIALGTALISGFGGYLINVYVKPWLAQRNLTEAAEIVVNAVEAILGRHLGEEKWELALKKMEEMGFDIDEEAVLDALRAAWQKLNTNQIAAGVKDPDYEDYDEDEAEEN